MTAVIALVTVAYEAGVRRLGRRHAGPDGPLSVESDRPAEGELTRWAAVVDRLLHSSD
jgi:hypothetical protein